MERQGTDNIIELEWDLTEDPDFSVHRALRDAIYAAHDPLTGFLGKVWDWCKRAWKGFTNWLGRVWTKYKPVIVGVLAGVATILTGGTLGAAAWAAVSGAIATWAGGQGIDVAGLMDILPAYYEAIGAVLPESWKETLEALAEPITGYFDEWTREQWARIKTQIMAWAETYKPAVDRIKSVLEPWQEAISKTIQESGIGNAWADRRLSGEVLASIIATPPEFGLMTDLSFQDYIAELKGLVKVVPPIPPVSMPEFHFDHLTPETHQLWETVTGIPKIIPAIEGVWDSIKNVWSIIKDNVIFISNWLRYTFQETLNLIITGVGDITRFICGELGELTAKIWESVGNLTQGIRSTMASLIQGASGWIQYLVEFFRSSLGSIREVLGGIPQYLGEVLWKIGSSVYQVIGNLGTWFYEALSALSSNLYQGITWVGTVVHSVFTEYLPALFQWLWAQIRDLGEWVTSVAVPAIVQESKGAWSFVEEHFKNYAYMAYSAAESQLKGFIPMTPEKAPRAAMGLLGVAIAFGMGAHTLSTVAELAHPLKEMGVHTLSAFMADMGNFGTIAASTMGILIAYSLRRPMGYYVNSIFRPTWPRAGDLMMMAVKPDISIEQFRRGMSYEGYSEEWINAYQRTMYREPRYFELSMMGEDEAATNEWIFRKARRAGYTPEDSIIFVKSLLKKVARTQITDAYRQAFYCYKEGYITRDQFGTYLDALEMRPEAKFYAVLAADLAYRLDYIGDMVTLLTNTYQNDLMSEEDFKVAIFSLGMEDRKARIAIQKARIRKIPKVMREVTKEAETQVREVQRKLQEVYREYYRAGKITEVEYWGYLQQIGMTPEMAELTVELEALRVERIATEEAEKEREKVLEKTQAEMVKLYREQYRRGLISFEALVGSFILAGIDSELALAMAETEEVKLIPKTEAEA